MPNLENLAVLDVKTKIIYYLTKVQYISKLYTPLLGHAHSKLILMLKSCGSHYGNDLRVVALFSMVLKED